MVLQILNNGELMNHNNNLQEGIMFVVSLIRSPSRTKNTKTNSNWRRKWPRCEVV